MNDYGPCKYFLIMCECLVRLWAFSKASSSVGSVLICIRPLCSVLKRVRFRLQVVSLIVIRLGSV